MRVGFGNFCVIFIFVVGWAEEELNEHGECGFDQNKDHLFKNEFEFYVRVTQN